MKIYTDKFNEIMTKMSVEDFSDNSKLSPLYLIGYHHYKFVLDNKDFNINTEEEK